MSQSNETGRKLRVAVLMGGTSAERDISLSTGKMILSALDPMKYIVTAIDTQDIVALPGASAKPLPAIPGPTAEPDRTHGAGTRERGEMTANAGDAGAVAPVDTEGDRSRPDVVFIALHGKGGEDGAAQGMLELLGIPYTGSGVLASALAMNKSMSKTLYRSAQIPVVEDLQIRKTAGHNDNGILGLVEEKLGGFPVFVKPNAEGSTFGCTLVKSAELLFEAVANAHRYDSIALIERYVRGMEITVGVLEEPSDPECLLPLPVIEIVPKNEYYDYESKYAEGGSEHHIPARLPEDTLRQAQEIAVKCHRVLGCRGMSRTDLLATADALYVLETNTIPGMTPTSLLPQAAEHAGISFSALLDRIIASSLAE